MQGGKGTAASGIGTVECSRHDMKWPTAVGDLQKGEQSVCYFGYCKGTCYRSDPRYA